MSQTIALDDPRAFSAIADVYDAEYSSQLTIRLQRRIYWQYLDRFLHADQHRILDMNCGTGTDAVHTLERYKNQNHEVTGVDISPKMVAQFNAKARQRGLANRMRAVQSPLQSIAELALPTFDLVTSNFGGLNCLTEDELRELAIDLHNNFTNPGAHVVAVVMPSFCAWETLYYLAKGDTKAAFRRQSKEGASANIGGTYIRTYYYSAKKFASLMEGFAVARVVPLGSFLPPSYLDNFFRRHSRVARACTAAERALSSAAIAARFSDHYIIDLVRQ
jgi:SAM-dependent methyltransferase